MTDINERIAKVEGALEQVSKVAHSTVEIAIEVKSGLSKSEERYESLQKQVVRHSEKSDQNYKELNSKIDEMFGKFNDKLGRVLTVLETNKGRDNVLKYVIGIVVSIIAAFITKSMGIW